MGHIGGGNRGHIVGDAGAVLADHHAAAAGHAGEGVFHMTGGLLMTHRDEVNACGREEVKQIHVCGTENAADMFDAFFYEDFGHGLTGGHFRHSCSFCLRAVGGDHPAAAPSQTCPRHKAQSAAKEIRAVCGASINHLKIIDYFANYMPTRGYFISK